MPAIADEEFWAIPTSALHERLQANAGGLSSVDAEQRLRTFGRNAVSVEKTSTRLTVLWNQIRSPLLLLLVFAAAVALATAEWTEAVIVVTIVAATVGIGYRREYTAQLALKHLQARIKTRANVVRDGRTLSVAIEQIVPGDVILLAAGSLVPADGVVLEATECHVSEAALTGESFPVEKSPGVQAMSTPLAQRSNCVWQGTNVRSGTARCLVVATGPTTQYGHIAHRLTVRPPATEFDRGLRRFGYLLTVAMLVMVLLVFVAHVAGGRPTTETLLFAIALAVGLSPELMPAILSVNLSRGAQLMAEHGVLVRRLDAIENLGSMDILCTDKTGTLTEGVVRLEGAYDCEGRHADAVLEFGALNASFETGLPSPLDDAILHARTPDGSAWRRLAEVPFDFVRKRVSVVLEGRDGVLLVSKGAFHHVLDVCRTLPGGVALDDEQRCALERHYDAWCEQGIRVLGVAVRRMAPQTTYGRDDERELEFAGFLTFLDRPREGVAQAIADLERLGVTIKVITGDSKAVARHVASLVGLPSSSVLTGAELQRLGNEALWYAAERTDLFVEVDPDQKERILRALRKTGHVVGFLGDGVNDTPAMHAADTSISVDEATDVARAAADFVLLDRHLDVIRRGIEEGRRTFANTLKYVNTTTSANLGNMVSMAVASLFLPFLPLLAGQILLNNFISDIPAIGIADDSVDPELVQRPQRWNVRSIARFMVEFGAMSSAFDFLTFGVLLAVFHATPELFRTGWFVESLLTELVIAMVVRTRRPFFRSRPGRILLVSSAVLVPLALAISYLPYAHTFGFVPLPLGLIATLLGITALYVIAVELLKRWRTAT